MTTISKSMIIPHTGTRKGDLYVHTETYRHLVCQFA